MDKWHLIENHPLLSTIYREPPLISLRKRKSLRYSLELNSDGQSTITQQNSGSRVQPYPFLTSAISNLHSRPATYQPGTRLRSVGNKQKTGSNRTNIGERVGPSYYYTIFQISGSIGCMYRVYMIYRTLPFTSSIRSTATIIFYSTTFPVRWECSQLSWVVGRGRRYE